MGNTLHEVIFLNHQEYAHINFIALDLLIDAGINCLPVDAAKIASVYGFGKNIDLSKSRYDNIVEISRLVLSLFGYQNNIVYSEYLAIKIMSPLVILKEIGISSSTQLEYICELPPLPASMRFDLYKIMSNKTEIGSYSIEKRVYKNFTAWVNSVRRNRKI